MSDLVNPTPLLIPKHVLDVWLIVLIILATILVMTSMLLFPAAAVIFYRIRTHPIRSTS
ncbi:small integral membrane protein 3 [Discoglossus pictus]